MTPGGGFVTLARPLGPEQVGNKFWNLARLARRLPVPRAVCVTAGVFREALGPDRLAFLERFFEDLRATVGCFLLSSMPRLEEVVRGVELSGSRREALKTRMEEVFGGLEGRRFAVRSSAAHEDAPRRSFAGVYRSRLDLSGFDEVCAAVAGCWRAYYSFPAIAARLRADDFSPEPELALIVQEMVPAVLAGVAFTRGPGGQGGAVVEYVAGAGEALVSGAAAPRVYRPGAGPRPQGPEARALAGAARAASRARAILGCDVDLEWAWDGRRLYVLQARHITGPRRATLAAAAGAAGQEAAEPGRAPESADAGAPGPRAPGAARGGPGAAGGRLELGLLYLDSGLPSRIDLRECRDVYGVYVPKRARAYRLAAQMGVDTGAAYVVEFNLQGLRQRGEELSRRLSATPAPEVVVDVSNNIRQIIVPKGEVGRFLEETFGLDPTGLELHTVIVRDYVRGQYGFISRLDPSGGLLVEASTEGLLGINRGIADCRRIFIPDPDRPPEGGNLSSDAGPAALEEFCPAFPTIAAFTRALNREMPGTQLEWVLESRRPYFVDYSRTGEAPPFTRRPGTLVVSPGMARGPALSLAADEVLRRLSIGPAVSVNKYDEAREHAELAALIQAVAGMPQKPVVFAPRPYAILSALFDYVAGFVFAQGSLLCHLAILLREAGIPAVVCPGVEFSPGSEVLIEDGRLTIF
ncbi:MAG: hypothetical protein K6T75_10030 [Acetobacteraceae bacterium]|nr:hypothetical protein [Acetobacteraceae bacterium]